MTIPKPKKYETNKEFIKRCMGNAAMNQDYPNKNDRYTVCEFVFKKNFMPE